MHQHFASLAIDRQIRQCDVGNRVVIPVITGRGLVAPDVFAGRTFHGNDAIRAEVVSGTSRYLSPWAGLACADIDEILIGVISNAAPYRTASTGDPPFLGCIPCFYPLGIDWLLERLRRIARYRVELPEFLSGVGVIGCKESADCIFSTAGADDHSTALDDAGRHCNRVGKIRRRDS